VRACRVFGDKVAFVGLAGTMHEVAANMEGIKFIPGELRLGFSLFLFLLGVG
jgi:hypothetical protein